MLYNTRNKLLGIYDKQIEELDFIKNWADKIDWLYFDQQFHYKVKKKEDLSIEALENFYNETNDLFKSITIINEMLIRDPRYSDEAHEINKEDLSVERYIIRVSLSDEAKEFIKLIKQLISELTKAIHDKGYRFFK